MTEPRAKCDTLVSLRDYLETRLAAQEQAVAAARVLMEARMERAETAMERRLDGLNHLREATVSKAEYISGHSALTAEFHAEAAALRAEVAGLKEWRSEQRGKASIGSMYLSIVLACGSLLVALVTLWHSLE